MQDVKLYDTGFTLLKDSHGEFFESNEIIRQLNASERNQLIDAARASQGDVFEVRLGGTVYLGAETLLFNDYELFVLAPKSEVNAEVTASLTRFSVIFVVAYTLVLIAAFIIGKRMGRPLASLSAFMRRAGTTGDILYTPEDEQALTQAIEGGGEIGRLVKDSGIFIDHIIEASRELESIANGDLTVEIKTLSAQDTMANSLNKMISNLNLLFNEVHNSAGQVAGGSKQIAEGAQSLANNSGKQSAIIGEIAGSAEKGGVQMQNLIGSVNEINEASKDIIKVMKLIDDVALKTNILALNASVEAARAGEYGRSFSVVAEEVRSLAAQSTQAAKETSLMIENSIEKAEAGSRIAGETYRSFTQIIDGISKVTDTVSVNSAAAEESAAAAEEMSAQSVTLEDFIKKFKLKGGNTGSFNR
jgi:methyl-accepting chemotaxis protein